MNNSFFFSIHKIILFLCVFILFICFLFIPLFPTSASSSFRNENIALSASGFVWPIPGFTRITSPFGKRNAPTGGASSYHKGMDIGATQGSNLIAATDGQITFLGFLGGGGYTVTLSVGNMKISYCHVNPNFLVRKGDLVKQGQIIAQVGPKYVDRIIGNPYHDSTGRPTNGATTGPHLHLGIRIDGDYVDPLPYF